MYPEPPHQIIAVYRDDDEIATFAQLCAVVEASGCAPNGVLKVGPREQDFVSISDLGADVRTVSPSERARLIAGDDPALRVVKAGYAHPEFGTVVVEYLLGDPADRHPLAVSMGAGALGMPPERWAGDDRRAADALDAWSRKVLRAAPVQCDALYGGVAVEATLPTPTRLSAGKHHLSQGLYVSQHLLDRDPEAESTLRRAFADGEASEWERGLFCSAWGPHTGYDIHTADHVDRAVAEVLTRTLAATA